jgi:hypothetical protein
MPATTATAIAAISIHVPTNAPGCPGWERWLRLSALAKPPMRRKPLANTAISDGGRRDAGGELREAAGGGRRREAGRGRGAAGGGTRAAGGR